MEEERRQEERKQYQTRRKQANPLYNEIFMLVYIGFSVFLTLCMYSSTFGDIVGQYFRDLMLGLMGIGGMLLPPVMAYHGISRLFLNKTQRKGRALWGVCAFLCLISLTHTISRTERQVVFSTSEDITGSYYASGSIANGGYIGGILGDVFYNAMGRPGAIFTLFVALTAACILFSGHSLSVTVRIAFSYLYFFIASALSAAFHNTKDIDDYLPGGKRVAKQHIRINKKPAAYRAQVKTRVPLPEPPRTFPEGRRIIKPPTISASGQKNDKVQLVFEELQRKRPIRPRNGVRARQTADIDSIPVRGLPDEKLVGESNAESADSQPVPAPADSGRLHSLSVHTDKSPVAEKNDADDKTASSDWIDELLAARAGGKPENGDAPRVYGLGFDEHQTEEADYQKFINNFDEPDQDDVIFESSGRRGGIPISDSQPVRSMSIPEGTDDVDMYRNYTLPTIDFLNRNPGTAATESRAQILDNSYKLEETLRSFKVEAKVVEVSVGPTVTRYEMAPGQGVKVSSIANLSNDLALSLAASGIRIEAPIPGKSAVGIEIPNKEMQPVYLREIIEDEVFKKFPSKLAFAVGKDIAGNTVVADVAKMPHLLIAGATGAGKSVCINTLITSILYKAKPNEVKLLMVDPKVVELNVYNGIPHLLAPVVTDSKKASAVLNWAVVEMDIRYNLFAEANVRDIKSYNAVVAERGESGLLPQIVIIIDELADLMMVAKGEIEELICRLAQKARAAGLHLIIATQRPSVDVITGLIKANIPSRLAFAVSSGTDSRTVLDMTGAEKLLGKGDMLFLPSGLNKPIRIQCGFISEREVEHIVEFLKEQNPDHMNREMAERVTDINRINDPDDDLDTFYHEAVEFLISKGKASASMLQRQFRIGYNRASRLIEELEARGIVSPEDGSKPRKVLITMEQWRNNQ